MITNNKKLEKGDLLGKRYSIEKLLGTGMSGNTYLANDILNNELLCAVKVLNPSSTDIEIRDLLRERFKQEARYLEELDGFNEQVPKLYEYDDENHYIVQEYIEGISLNELKGSLTEIEVKNILLSLLNIIEYIHTKYFIHRDIKPENVILREGSNLPVLIDFGAVKEIETTIIAKGKNALPQTIIIGTKGYWAPEQAGGKPVYGSDIYSLGMVGIYLFSGINPKDIENDSKSGIKLWRNLVPNVSPDFAEIIDKAIKPYPSQRFLSAKNMQSQLESVIVAENNNQILKELSDNISDISKRPLAKLFHDVYQKCHNCDFYITSEEEFCQNCGTYNRNLLSSKELFLVTNAVEDYRRKHYDKKYNDSSFPFNLRYLTNLSDSAAEAAFFLAVVGGIIGAIVGYNLEKGFFNTLFAMVVGGILGGLILMLPIALIYLWIYSIQKQELIDFKEKRNDLLKIVNRNSTNYLNNSEQTIKKKFTTFSQREEALEARILSHQEISATDLFGNSSEKLHEAQSQLEFSLAESSQIHSQYRSKYKEIKLLRLYNVLRATAFEKNTDQKKIDSTLKHLKDFVKCANEVFIELSKSNLIKAAEGKAILSRIIFVLEEAKGFYIELELLTSKFVRDGRSNEEFILPPDFILYLDKLGTFLTFEDFYNELQKLESK